MFSLSIIKTEFNPIKEMWKIQEITLDFFEIIEKGEWIYVYCKYAPTDFDTTEMSRIIQTILICLHRTKSPFIYDSEVNGKKIHFYTQDYFYITNLNQSLSPLFDFDHKEQLERYRVALMYQAIGYKP